MESFGQPYEDYRPQGTPAGTLVILPGVNSGAYLMANALPTLEHWRVISLNPPGVNGVPLPLPFSVKAYARQVVDTLSRLDVKDFVLVGHSLGGYAAQEVARLVPDRVKRLVLVSTSRGQPDTAVDIAGMQKRIGMNFWDFQQHISKHEGEGHKPLFGPGFADREPEVYETFLKLRRRHLPTQAATLAHLSAGGMFSSMGFVRKLRVPTLVIHGNADNLVTVDSGRKLSEAIPGAQWLELYGVGHFPMLEYASFWDKVRQFAEEATPGVEMAQPESLLSRIMKGMWVRG
ncbi:MAG: alpha/beta hydrolase [Alphaproteobacteria bacterium]|nr:MAG: alpha/beta hydrolase [Alphaproteobacteria bacterium]